MLTFVENNAPALSALPEGAVAYDLDSGQGTGAPMPEGLASPNPNDWASYASRIAATPATEAWLSTLQAASHDPASQVYVVSAGPADGLCPRTVVAGILQARGVGTPGVTADMRSQNGVYEATRASMRSIGTVAPKGSRPQVPAAPVNAARSPYVRSRQETVEAAGPRGQRDAAPAAHRDRPRTPAKAQEAERPRAVGRTAPERGPRKVAQSQNAPAPAPTVDRGNAPRSPYVASGARTAAETVSHGRPAEAVADGPATPVVGGPAEASRSPFVATDDPFLGAAPYEPVPDDYVPYDYVPEETAVPAPSPARPARPSVEEVRARTAERVVAESVDNRRSYDPRSTIHAFPVTCEVPGRGPMTFPTIGHAYLAIRHPGSADEVFVSACNGQSPDVLFADQEFARKYPAVPVDGAAVLGNLLCLHLAQHPDDIERMAESPQRTYGHEGFFGAPGVEASEYMDRSVAAAMRMAAGTPFADCVREVEVGGARWTGEVAGHGLEGTAADGVRASTVLQETAYPDGFAVTYRGSAPSLEEASVASGPSVAICAPSGPHLMGPNKKYSEPSSPADLTSHGPWGPVEEASAELAGRLVEQGAARIVVPFGPGAPQAVLHGVVRQVRAGRAADRTGDSPYRDVEVCVMAPPVQSLRSGARSKRAADLAVAQLHEADAVIWCGEGQKGRAAEAMASAAACWSDCAVVMAPAGELFGRSGERGSWHRGGEAARAAERQCPGNTWAQRPLLGLASMARAMGRGGREVAVVPCDPAGVPDLHGLWVVGPDRAGRDVSAKDAARARWEREAARGLTEVEVQTARPAVAVSHARAKEAEKDARAR